MSGLVEKVKDKLHIGKSSDTDAMGATPASHPIDDNTMNQGPHAPSTGKVNTSKSHTSRTSHHTSSHMTGHGKHPTCNQDHEHTMACGRGVHEHGKQDAWSHTHAKTSEASKAANASELAACKANEHYESLTNSQNNAQNARRRQRELEAEMEKLRGQGVDVSGHHKRLEDHKRHLADLENQHALALKAAQEKDRDAALREREAGKLQDAHARKQQGLTPLEAELENLRKERESAHSNHQTLLGEHNDRHKKHQARAGEIEHHNKELLNHGNRVKELEAELAAAKEGADKHHRHLMGLKDEHDAYERDLPDHQKRLDHANSRIQLLKQKEEEMMRQHGATQDDIEKHRRMLADTQKDAEAHRAHADEARRHAEGLPGQMEQHKQGLSQAQQEHANALRRQKEIDAQQHKLGSHLDKARAHADQADTTVQQHTDNLEQAKREAEMHARRKDEAWREAQETGRGGASLEGSHLTNLKEKIKDMGPGHHSGSTTSTTHHTTSTEE